MSIPFNIFFWGFSPSIKIEKRYKKTGPEEAIMGALTEGACLSPRKKKEMFTVIPKKDKSTKVNQSFFSILSWFTAKGKRIAAPSKNRIKARVNGGIF
jgi:hypothetical protein